MAEQILKPRNIMNRESYMALAPENRKNYLENLVKELVQLNKGITLAQIVDTLMLSYDAARRHITRLESSGEIYRAVFGNSVVYFPNGRNIHSEDEMNMVIGDTTFVFSIISNQFDDFLMVQEKTIEGGKRRAKGAIMIPLKEATEFYRKSAEFLRGYTKKKTEMI